jgi:tRNA uridine 5-carboxymethylaminomethyl modification enzyme
MLNGSKGSAVWVRERWSTVDTDVLWPHLQSPRAQLDRKLYKGHMQDVIFNYLDLDARATSVSDLVFDRQMASSNSTRSVWGTVTGV